MQKKNSPRRFHRRTKPGAAPGVIAVDPQAPQPHIVATSYGADAVEQLEISDISDINALRGRRAVLWIDVAGLGDAAAIRQIGEIFGLHALALEDVVNVHQQVKLEDYGDHLFIVGRMVDDVGHGRTEQVSIFLGEGFVVTFQQRPGDWLAPLRQRLADSRSELRASGADFLAYAVLDAVIDGYFPLLEHFGERLDALDDAITDDPPRYIIHRIHEVRGVLRALRRVIWSHRDAIGKLLHDPSRLVSGGTRVYIRDCYDHTIQLVDVLETYNETCADLRDVYLSSVSNRLNEIMMVLTIIATIFIPLGFIASLYGMNFNTRVSPWNMPELNWFFGYPFAIGLMVLVSVSLLAYFHARGWLWRDRK
ncbi:magnesium/cobalt transporter CorA [Haliea sp. E17]|uniref:magnesium/cobalt transporter CorA n=1 Tax=Haliea sp. E17 TaxID=3401576 RepID=UPI003AAFCA9F